VNVGMALKEDFEEFFPEGAGAAGDEDGFHGLMFLVFFNLGVAISEAC
jgi:hypothetical protein